MNIEEFKVKIKDKMNNLNLSCIKFFKVLGSYIIALARLVIWTILTFFSGLQRTLFVRSEVVGVELKVAPLRCDMEDTDEKLAYIDKLCMENPELVCTSMEDDFIVDNGEFPFDEDDDL